MRLIINCSSLSSTGPVQVAISFIKECIYHDENNYLVFMSTIVASLIDKDDYPANFQFVTFSHHPAKGMKGFFTRREMKKYEYSYKPDCVFTLFGPSVWKPKAVHLQGFAYGHYIYEDSPAFQLMSIKERLHRKVLKAAHVFHLKRDGDFYVCETEDVTKRVCRLLNIKAENCFTVTNTYSHFFELFVPRTERITPMVNDREVFRFLLLSSPHPHKNLTILNSVIPIILSSHLPIEIRFVVTISNDAYYKLFSKEARILIDNIGPLQPKDCPQAYFETDALFSPTLLECFSANYPEAMIMRRPILTTDLPFAHSICADAALFYSPLDAEDAASKIIQLVSDASLREELIQKGVKRLSYFCSPEERAMRYLQICKTISKIE